MTNEEIWGYIDQLESLGQGILDLTAELHQMTGPRIPLSTPVVPTQMQGGVPAS